ncbi:hypothetical protein KAH81_04120 [bacterium]|nr:hypothetical protein [bacterium]
MRNLCVFLLIATMAFCGVRIASLKIGGPNRCMETVSVIDAVLMADSTIDIILAPAENLGGDSNRARIIFSETTLGWDFSVADTFTRTREVFSALQAIASLAETYAVTIIPGTLWEVDSFNRCFECVPIFESDGNIARIRRKAHQTKTDPNIDASIILDTVFTKEGDIYSYLITISNEAGDLPSVYGSSESPADIWLALDRRWSENLIYALENINTVYPPNWTFVHSAVDSPSFKALIDSNWISSSGLLVLSDFDAGAGATYISNLFPEFHTDNDWSVIPDYSEMSSYVVIDVDPDMPTHNMRVDIIARDTIDAPVENLFVNYGPPDCTPIHAGWTDDEGVFMACIADEESLYFLFSIDGMIPMPEETTLYVSYAESRCTIFVALEPDSFNSISEVKRPENEEIAVWPNPFNASCVISASTRVVIYDLMGKAVRQLEMGVQNKTLWDGCDNTGNELPTGIYLVKALDNRSSSIKICLMR